MHSRPLQLAHLLPVRKTRRALHQHPWLSAFDRTNDIMHHGNTGRLSGIIPATIMPGRIAVPGYHIQQIGKLPVIQPFKILHQVGCNRKGGIDPAEWLNLMPDEIGRLMRYKPSPVQVHSVNLRLSMRRRGFDLAPFRNRMAPECGPPDMIQLIQCSVLIVKPGPECLLAIIAMAIAAKLIGYMPADDRRMMAVPLRKLHVDRMNLLPVYRRSITMIMPEAVQVPNAPFAYAQHLRVLLRHPGRSCAAWRSQKSVNAIGRKTVQYTVKPVERKYPLLRLQ